MKKLLISGLVLLTALSFGQTEGASSVQSVSISSKNGSIRDALGSVFAQAKKSYVIDPAVSQNVYLSLDAVEFEEALAILSKLAGLKIELQNGIYFVSKAKPVVKPVEAPKPDPKAFEPKIERLPIKPAGKLPAAALNAKVTTRMIKADLKSVIESLSRQSSVTIVMDPGVPAYKLDAFLINTSLKYALDQVTKAAGLSYRLTDEMSILVYRPEPVNNNRVSLIKE